MIEELEQKAEEYAKYTRIKDDKTYQSFDDECISEVQDYEGNYIYLHNRIEKAYKDGYIQGQKDKLTEKEKLVGTFINVDLKKENEELKAQIKDLCSSLDIMNNRESELLAHIEKMKRCSTCKHKYKDTCYLKLMNGIECHNKDKWELAE